MTLSFTQFIELENRDAIALVSGHNADGMRIYAYLRMTKAQIQAFDRAIKTAKPIDFDDFGEVLVSGEGSPDPALLEELRQEYDFR